MTPPSSRPSLAERAYEQVEEMIVTLELPPGSVFSEAELSKRVGIGRTPLREALQRLAAHRLIAVLPRRGMMVTEINATEYLALLETRAVLDRLVVAAAARRAREEERAFFRRNATDMLEVAASGDAQAFLRLDRACDEALEHAARNPFACAAAAPLHSHCRRFWSMHRHAGDLQASARLHAALSGAVADSDEQAASSASDRLIAYLESFTREALELA